MEETHLNKKREKMFREVFVDQFHIITKNREMKDRDPGSGGVMVLVRKGIGNVTEIKRKRTAGLLWVQICCEGRIFIIAVVYMVPSGSVYYGLNEKIREELEQDLGEYKEKGIVIIIGDFNSRI